MHKKFNITQNSKAATVKSSW